jgi:hypothetical protein
MGKRKTLGEMVDPDWCVAPEGKVLPLAIHGHGLTPATLATILHDYFGEELTLADFLRPRESRWRFRTYPWNHPDRTDDGASGWWEEKPNHPRAVPVTVLTMIPDAIHRVREHERRAIHARRQKIRES